MRQAIALNADLQRAHVNLGLILGRTNRDGEALSEFQRGGCTEAAAHANLAFTLAVQKRTGDAQRHYEYALSLDPSCKTALDGLASLRAARTASAARSSEAQTRLEARMEFL
jgi:Flp pilus assembly protein TadD